MPKILVLILVEGYRQLNGMLVAAEFHGDLEMEMLEVIISSRESTSSVFVRAIAKLKDKKLRFVIMTTGKRLEAQISLCSLPPLFHYPIFASLVDGIICLLSN